MDDGLTVVEMRDFLAQISTLIKGGVLNKNERDRILYICLEACDREMAKMKEEQKDGIS